MVREGLDFTENNDFFSMKYFCFFIVLKDQQVAGVNILNYSQKNIWEKFPILDNFGKSLFILTKIFRSIQKFYWKIYI